MAINWSPNVAEEVEQNVRTIVATEIGSVPGDRAFGSPHDMVDLPAPQAAARLHAVVQAIRKYEPRVDAKTIRLVADNDGKLTATYRLVQP